MEHQWFTVGELSVIAALLQTNDEDTDDCGKKKYHPSTIPILDYQTHSITTLNTAMLYNHPCIVQNITSYPEQHLQIPITTPLDDTNNNFNDNNNNNNKVLTNSNSLLTSYNTTPSWTASDWSRSNADMRYNGTYLDNIHHQADIPPSHISVISPITTKINNNTPTAATTTTKDTTYFQFIKDYSQNHLNPELSRYEIDLEHLEQRYGEAEVNISNCSKKDSNSQHCDESTFGEYLQAWRSYKDTVRETSNKKVNNHDIQPFTKYCRDFHLALYDFETIQQDQPGREYYIGNNNERNGNKNSNNPTPNNTTATNNNNNDNNAQSFYMPPLCISDDYLNHYWDYLTLISHYQFDKTLLNSQQNNNSSSFIPVSRPQPPTNDDYRFVYIGPHSSWTPMHRDVYASYSWSGNVIGAKLWIFFPESFVKLMQVDPKSTMVDVYDIFDGPQIKLKSPQLYDVLLQWIVDLRSYIYDTFILKQQTTSPSITTTPTTSLALEDKPQQNNPTILLQSSGDLVFVPSFYAHSVVNLTDCISINHNWGNAYNLDFMTSQLLFDYISLKCDMFEYRHLVGNNDELINGIIKQDVINNEDMGNSSNNDDAHLIVMNKYNHLNINGLISLIPWFDCKYTQYTSVDTRKEVYNGLNKNKSLQHLSILDKYNTIINIPPQVRSTSVTCIVDDYTSGFANNDVLSNNHDDFSKLVDKVKTNLNYLLTLKNNALSNASKIIPSDQCTFHDIVNYLDDVMSEQRVLNTNCGMNIVILYNIIIITTLYNIANLKMLCHAKDIVKCLFKDSNTKNTNDIHNNNNNNNNSNNSVDLASIDDLWNGNMSPLAHTQYNTCSDIIDLFMHQNTGYYTLQTTAQQHQSQASQNANNNPTPHQVLYPDYLKSHINQWLSQSNTNDDKPNTLNNCKHNNNIKTFHFDAYNNVKFYGLSIFLQKCAELINYVKNNELITTDTHVNAINWFDNMFNFYLQQIEFSFVECHKALKRLFESTDFMFLYTIALSCYIASMPSHQDTVAKGNDLGDDKESNTFFQLPDILQEIFKPIEDTTTTTNINNDTIDTINNDIAMFEYNIKSLISSNHKMFFQIGDDLFNNTISSPTHQQNNTHDVLKNQNTIPLLNSINPLQFFVRVLQIVGKYKQP